MKRPGRRITKMADPQFYQIEKIEDGRKLLVARLEYRLNMAAALIEKWFYQKLKQVSARARL